MEKNNIGMIALLLGAGAIAYFLYKNKSISLSQPSGDTATAPISTYSAPVASTVTPVATTPTQTIIERIYHDAPYIIPPVVTPVVVVPNVTTTNTYTNAPSYIYAPTTSTTTVTQPSVPMGTGSNDAFTEGMHFQPTGNVSSPTAKKYGAVF